MLLSDGKRAVHQNHVVTLPAEGGGSMAAISFTGALKIPVSTGLGKVARRGASVHMADDTGLLIKAAQSWGVPWLSGSLWLGSTVP